MEGGKLAVTGILSGIGWTEGNHIPGDDATHWDVSNAQVFVQKTTGWWQFYLQGGAYNDASTGSYVITMLPGYVTGTLTTSGQRDGYKLEQLN